eukprot:jgi/Chrzof1/7396/Cz02g21360.t1
MESDPEVASNKAIEDVCQEGLSEQAEGAEQPALELQVPADTDEQAAEQTAPDDAGQYIAAATRITQKHSGNGTMTRPGTKSLTFSAPPYVPTAKPYPRADYSHSATQLMKIGHDNQLLVERLTEISHQPPGWVRDLNKTEPCNTASSAVNRRKAATTIAQENHALYQRLVTIKPSKDISRDTLEREHQANEQYLHNCSTFKGSKANTVV